MFDEPWGDPSADSRADAAPPARVVLRYAMRSDAAPEFGWYNLTGPSWTWGHAGGRGSGSMDQESERMNENEGPSHCERCMLWAIEVEVLIIRSEIERNGSVEQ